MTLKQELYQKCEAFINERFLIVQKSISEIEESLNSETKSSAGDKHETGRAMLHIEREKAGTQLQQIKKVKEALDQIDFNKTSEIICLGSIVFTSQMNYFMAISAGEIKHALDSFYAISPSTPIGELLMAKKVGDEVIFKDQKIKILRII